MVTIQDYSLALTVWCMKLKTKMFMKILVRIKKCVKSKYYDSNKLLTGKMKDQAGGVAIEEFVGLKPKMHSFSVDSSSEHKKAKGVNKNIVARISHGKQNIF